MTGKELLEEKILIDKINADLQTNNIDFVVYHGCECNILKNGLLDIEDRYLKELDYVIAGIHSNFDLDNKSQTERIIRALENPLVNILAHPTGRLINKRDEYNIDFDKILALSTKNNKILEINASPFRLDLDRHNIAKAISHNITMIINTDSHNIEQLDFMKYGVAEARQGGATKNSILNTRPVIVF